MIRRRNKCKHKFKITERSNVLQLDMMGYPLRLCILTCKECGKSEQVWLDTNVEEFDNKDNVILKWENAK